MNDTAATVEQEAPAWSIIKHHRNNMLSVKLGPIPNRKQGEDIKEALQTVLHQPDMPVFALDNYDTDAYNRSPIHLVKDYDSNTWSIEVHKVSQRLFDEKLRTMDLNNIKPSQAVRSF
jgi:hypothetical protein